MFPSRQTPLRQLDYPIGKTIIWNRRERNAGETIESDAPAGGLVLWEGPSRFDGSPIAAIATFRTDNRKTGPMIQTWIIGTGNESPYQAVRSGADAAVCGSCPLRGSAGKARSCYVNVLKGGPHSVYRQYRAGLYPP
jgi:hypothetical protein